MNKPVRVIFVANADIEFKRLSEIAEVQIQKGKHNSEEMKLLNSIKHKFEIIKHNPFHGNNIHKNLIPKSYNVQNLWRIELSHFWRMLYTIKGDGDDVICLVIDILGHKEYNKVFGYK